LAEHCVPIFNIWVYALIADRQSMGPLRLDRIWIQTGLSYGAEVIFCRQGLVKLAEEQEIHSTVASMRRHSVIPALRNCRLRIAVIHKPLDKLLHDRGKNKLSASPLSMVR
jgi:hypothetical protein